MSLKNFFIFGVVVNFLYMRILEWCFNQTATSRGLVLLLYKSELFFIFESTGTFTGFWNSLSIITTNFLKEIFTELSSNLN